MRFIGSFIGDGNSRGAMPANLFQQLIRLTMPADGGGTIGRPKRFDDFKRVAADRTGGPENGDILSQGS
jgi:hypothetical protein